MACLMAILSFILLCSVPPLDKVVTAIHRLQFRWMAERYANLSTCETRGSDSGNDTYHPNLRSDVELPVIYLASFCRKELRPSSEEFLFISQ